ncbi:hypothetical protein ACOIC7_29890, partial [Klebsiella pneumoniae]|uniref:hypothetical protein n=1 Tax=Klebsiella pneumoniae TaxID=573 RepID=UPI003B58F92E
GVDEPDEVRMPNGDTLVQYMGGREATATAQRLLALGHAPDTPVVVVEKAVVELETASGET